MRALALSKRCTPKDYQLATIPVPRIQKEDEVLVKVMAASVNPIDVLMASDKGKLLAKSKFPWKIGYDLAGIIVAVGAGVSKFKPGDEVYSLVGEEHRGSIAEYCLSSASKTAFKPKSLSFAEAASLPVVGTTAVQAFERAEKQVQGRSLRGKTVFVPGGLSGTGSVGVQVAKNVYGAGKVVTTLSTGKIPRVKEFFGENVIDEIVDYTKDDVVGSMGRGEVDFMYDVVGSSVSALGTVRKGGVIVSISTMPSGSDMRRNNPDMGTLLVWMLNVVDWVYRTWIGRKGVRYSYLVGSGSGETLEKLAEWVEEGKLRPVIGRKAKMEDIEEVRKGCQQVYDGKGSVGKFVIEIE